MLIFNAMYQIASYMFVQKHKRGVIIDLKPFVLARQRCLKGRVMLENVFFSQLSNNKVLSMVI